MTTSTTPHGLPYEPGTRYSNSDTYDEATTEVRHGWQIFVQKRPGGALTGRKSFVDHNNMLCGLEIAERKRQEARAALAPELLQIAEWAHAAFNFMAVHATSRQDRFEFARRRDVAWATLHAANGLTDTPDPKCIAVTIGGPADGTHLYELGTNKGRIEVYANTSSTASSRAKKHGYIVNDVNMVG